MDELTFFFNGWWEHSTTSSDYLQSDAEPLPPSLPPEDVPDFFSVDVQTSPIADGYQQDDLPQSYAPLDAWPHCEGADEEDNYHWNEPVLRGNVTPAPTAPVQETPWDYASEEVSLRMFADSYQQADNISSGSPPVQDTPIDFFLGDAMPLVVPTDYIQQDAPSTVPQLIHDSVLFDGNDLDLDELIILDDANFTPQYERAYELTHWQLAQDDVEDWRPDDQMLQPPAAPPNTTLLPDTGPTFDGNDLDLDELFILDDANFELPPIRATDWADEPAQDDWADGLQSGPVVNNTLPVNVEGAPGVLNLTGFAPSVVTNGAIAPTEASGLLVTYAPSVVTGNGASPAAGQLSLTGYAPVITQPVMGVAGALALTGYAPLVGLGTGILPQVGSLNLTGYVPLVRQAISVLGVPTATQLTGYAPTVVNDMVVTPAVGRVNLTGYAPAVTQPAAVVVQIGTQALAGYAPLVQQQREADPASAQLTLQTYAPSLIQLTTSYGRQYDIEPEDRSLEATQVACMKTIRFPFDPNAQLDYQFKWARWCDRSSTHLVAGEDGFEITVDAGLEVVSAESQSDIVTVFVRLNPAAPASIGQRPQVHCDIVTQGAVPRRDRRSIELLIVAR